MPQKNKPGAGGTPQPGRKQKLNSDSSLTLPKSEANIPAAPRARGRSFRRLPAYAKQLSPVSNVVMISPDWVIARRVMARGGLCLVVDADPARFEFAFAKDLDDVFVLVSSDKQSARAMEVGRYAKGAGARRVSVIQVGGLL
jgi:hypothetical protein